MKECFFIEDSWIKFECCTTKHKINLIGTNASLYLKNYWEVGAIAEPFRIHTGSFVPVKLNTILGDPLLPVVDTESSFWPLNITWSKGCFVYLCQNSHNPELPQPHSNLLTIFTGQDHISKVVVFCQVSKSSTLPLIFAKYFI